MTTIIYDTAKFSQDEIKVGDWLLLEDNADDEEENIKNLCVVSRVNSDTVALICIESHSANRMFDPVLWSGSKPMPSILKSQLARYKVTKVNVEIKVGL